MESLSTSVSTSIVPDGEATPQTPSIIDALIKDQPWHNLIGCGVVKETVRGFTRTALVLFGDSDLASNKRGRYYFLDTEWEEGEQAIEGLLSALMVRYPKRAQRILSEIQAQDERE